MSAYDEMSFDDLLNRAKSEVPESRPLPSGTWLLKLRSVPTPKAKVKEVGNASVLFVFQAVEPTANVDEDELATLGENYDVKGNRMFHRVWLETGADWDGMNKLLAKLGVSDFPNYPEAFKEAKGATVYGDLSYRTFKNSAGETVEENTISNFQAVE